MVLGEELSRGGVEEDQAIESNSDGEIVGKSAVEVAVPRAEYMCAYECDNECWRATL